MAYRRILIRRDTAANWTANNPTLARQLPSWATDTKQTKVEEHSLEQSCFD